jgi:hypothetical protein
MKKLILLSIIMIGLFSVSASAQTKVRVKFDKNRYEKTVSGSVNGTSYVDYVVRVEKYNFIQVDFVSGGKNLKFTIRDTQGTPMSGGASVRTFEGEAERTGDYTIRVFTNGGNANLKFKLRISAFMGT